MPGVGALCALGLAEEFKAVARGAGGVTTSRFCVGLELDCLTGLVAGLVDDAAALRGLAVGLAEEVVLRGLAVGLADEVVLRGLAAGLEDEVTLRGLAVGLAEEVVEVLLSGFAAGRADEAVERDEDALLGVDEFLYWNAPVLTSASASGSADLRLLCGLLAISISF